jgi:fatty-acyl-CoA synthase
MDPTFLIRRAALHYFGVGEFRCDGKVRPIEELIARAERLASSLLTMGLSPGDRVAILSENSLAYIEVDVALLFAGLVRVPLNARLGPADWEFVLEDSESSLLFLDPTLSGADKLNLDIEVVLLPSPGQDDDRYERLIRNSPGPTDVLVDPAQPAWLIYTSGTTGRPKGVVLSRRSILEVARNLLFELDTLRPGAESILTQSLSHGSGYFTLPILLSGGVSSVMPSFDAGWMADAITSRQVGMIKLVPATLEALLEELGEDASTSVGCTVYGAAPIRQATLQRARGQFGGRLVQIYGQTEAPVTITCLSASDHAREGTHLGSVGRPWQTVDLRLLGDDGAPVATGERGEIFVAGRHVMTGYWRQKEATRAVMDNGWVRTKDIGRMDERGYVYLEGRSDDMINSGGFLVAPLEVETVLNAYPAVAESIVVGLPHDRWGTQITAIVTLAEGADVSIADILAHCDARLGFRKPRLLLVAGEIPYTPYGKPDRAAAAVMLAHAAPESEPAPTTEDKRIGT